MKSPLVSVIMPTYNEKPEYVNEAVKSILNQTMTDFELVQETAKGKRTEACISSKCFCGIFVVQVDTCVHIHETIRFTVSQF